MDERTAVSAHADFHALIVGGLDGKTKTLIRYLLQGGRNRDALADPRRRQMLHVHMKTDGLLTLVHVRSQKLQAGALHQTDHRRSGEDPRNARAKMGHPHLGVTVKSCL